MISNNLSSSLIVCLCLLWTTGTNGSPVEKKSSGSTYSAYWNNAAVVNPYASDPSVSGLAGSNSNSGAYVAASPAANSAFPVNSVGAEYNSNALTDPSKYYYQMYQNPQQQSPVNQFQQYYEQAYHHIPHDATDLEFTTEIPALEKQSFLESLPSLASLGYNSFSNFWGALSGSGLFGGLGSGISRVATGMAPSLGGFVMMALAILGFPILQMKIPATGDIVKRSFSDSLSDTARLAREVLQSQECVERLACRVARMTRGNPLEEWISTKLEASPNKWMHRVSRSFKTAVSGADCGQFLCNPASQLRNAFRAYFFADDKEDKDKSIPADNNKQD